MNINEIIDKLMHLGADNTEPDEVWNALYHLALVVRQQQEQITAFKRQLDEQKDDAR